MRLRLCFLFALSLVPSSSFAQSDPQPDGLGIYFDLDATMVHATTTQPLQMVTAYLLATNVSATSGISGYELHMGIYGALALGYQSSCDCCLFGFPHIACGCLLGPLPWGPAIRLGTLTFFVLDPTTVTTFYLGPHVVPSIPGYPAYAVGDDPLDIRPFYVSSGSYDLPVATVNGEPPVPANPPTWGAVKALYR
jgi:hypothetical protein